MREMNRKNATHAMRAAKGTRQKRCAHIVRIAYFNAVQ